MKKTYVKKAVAMVGLVAMLTTSLTGCGKKSNVNKDLNADAVVLTVGDEKVKFSEAV